jgi:hypothetical protein
MAGYFKTAFFYRLVSRLYLFFSDIFIPGSIVECGGIEP